MKYFCYGEKLAMSMMSMQLLSYSSYLDLPFSLLVFSAVFTVVSLKESV